MESTSLPKVSKVISSKPIAEETAFQLISKFLEKEQKRLDPAALHQSGHWGDVFLVCESLAKSDTERDRVERLRLSAPVAVKEEPYDDSPAVFGSANDDTLPAAVPSNNVVENHRLLAVESSMASLPAVKQEDVKADEQPSNLQVKSEDDQKDAKSKRKAEKKAKKEKKKKKHKHE